MTRTQHRVDSVTEPTLSVTLLFPLPDGSLILKLPHICFPQECPRTGKTWTLDSVSVTDLTSGSSPATFYLRGELKAPAKTSASLQPAVSAPSPGIEPLAAATPGPTILEL